MSVPPPRLEILPPPIANGSEKRKATHQMHDERSEKRARTHEPDNRMDMEGQDQETAVVPLHEPRYITLERESVVLLSGHKGEVRFFRLFSSDFLKFKFYFRCSRPLGIHSAQMS